MVARLKDASPERTLVIGENEMSEMTVDLERIDPEGVKTWGEIKDDIGREVELRAYVTEAFQKYVELRVKKDLIIAKDELAAAKRQVWINRAQSVNYFISALNEGTQILLFFGALATLVGSCIIGGILAYRMLW